MRRISCTVCQVLIALGFPYGDSLELKTCWPCFNADNPHTAAPSREDRSHLAYITRKQLNFIITTLSWPLHSTVVKPGGQSLNVTECPVTFANSNTEDVEACLVQDVGQWCRASISIRGAEGKNVA